MFCFCGVQKLTSRVTYYFETRGKKFMRSTIRRTITSLVLVIAMVVGMTASLGGKAQAAPGTYTLRFSNNGISGVGNLPKDVATTPQYPTVKIPTQKPTRTNYVFQGYDTSSSATKVVYRPGDSIKLTKALTTLYPVWAGGASTFTLSFSANGKTVSNLPKAITTDPRYSVTIPSSKPTRSGYTFFGYDTSSAAKTVVYKPGASLKLTKNITLYPVWKAYIFLKDKDGKTHEYYRFEGETLESLGKEYLPVGYHFSDAQGKEVPVTKKITGSMSIYVTLNTCTISFYTLPEDSSHPAIVRTANSGQSIRDVRISPSKQKCVFIGWSKVKKAGKDDLLYSSYYPLFFEQNNTKMNLYAQYLSLGESREVTWNMTKSDIQELIDYYKDVKYQIALYNARKRYPTVALAYIVKYGSTIIGAIVGGTAGGAAGGVAGGVPGAVAGATAGAAAGGAAVGIAGEIFAGWIDSLNPPKDEESIDKMIGQLERKKSAITSANGTIQVKMIVTFDANKFKENASGLEQTYPTFNLNYVIIDYT